MSVHRRQWRRVPAPLAGEMAARQMELGYRGALESRGGCGGAPAVKAVVLAGGEGTRLRPLTFSTPKQMLPGAGRPVIERVVEELGCHGVDEVVLSLGYRPDAFIAAYPDGLCAGVGSRTSSRTARSTLRAQSPSRPDEAGVGDETFVAMNADV